jgi:hypothetical protein
VTLAGDIRRLATFQQRARESRVGSLASVQFYGRRFSSAEIEKLFHGNDSLRRGAVLHADIAVFVGDDLSGRERAGADDSGSVLVQDGRRQGVRYETAHWQIGRSLLDAITPGPSGDAGALLWYRAASSYLLREGRLPEARVHLGRARQIFPDTPFVFLDSAYLHQKFSSSLIQAAAQDFRADGGNPAVDLRRPELERAARYFQQVVALEPANAEARLRLGHTLGELGRHDEAAAELHKAIDTRIDGPQLYYAELFLGHEEQALGRRDQAKRHYENAAELYPKAQSPRLALSQLARLSGDRAGALLALRGVAALPRADFERFDPWWEYYEVHLEDAESLMEEMRGLAGKPIQ